MNVDDGGGSTTHEVSFSPTSSSIRVQGVPNAATTIVSLFGGKDGNLVKQTEEEEFFSSYSVP